jgi:hypothetical protein
MGECAYYLKADFKSNEAARIAASKLDDFFAQSCDAYRFYQDQRGKITNKSFWKEFESKFPMVFDYVKTLPGFKLTSNPQSVLSYNIDFGQDENNETLVQGTTVGWGDAEVWHLSNWTPLCYYIVSKFGAIKTVWDNEENGCGSLDNLQLYAYEDIVKNILSKENLLPLLLNIHPDLDLMIDINLRQDQSPGKKNQS